MTSIPWYHTVFCRVITVFIAAVLVLSAITAMMFTWQIRSMDAAMLDGINREAQQSLKNVAQELARVDRLSVECVYDDSIVRLAGAAGTISDYEKTTLMNRLFTRLALLRDSSNYILDAHISIPKLNRSLSSNGILSSFSGKTDKLMALEASGLRSVISRDKEIFYSGYLPAGSVLQDDAYQYVLVVEHDLKAIKKAIENTVGKDVTFSLFFPDGRRGAFSGTHTTAVVSYGDYPMQGQWQELNGDRYWCKLLLEEESGFSLAISVPFSSVNPKLRTLRAWLIVFAAVLMLFSVAMLLSLAVSIRSPLSRLVTAFMRMQHGDYSVRLDTARRDEFGYLFAAFNTMAVNTQTLMDEVYQQTIRAQSAQLKELQTWINPHFLFNSFFTISNMARLEDTKSVKRFSEYLAKYYQYLTKTNGDEMVFLSDEVEHSRLYISIQQLRFGEGLCVRFGDLPQEVASWQVPRLLLQPLVENVFQHGFEGTAEKSILVTFSLEEDMLVLSVENNGSISENEVAAIRRNLQTKNLSGIVNVHRRLRLQYGSRAGVRLSRSAMGGLSAKICIPREGKLC